MPDPVMPTPAMIAAAWDAWAPRHGVRPTRLGPGPAFVEAIRAALLAAPRDVRAPIEEQVRMQGESA